MERMYTDCVKKVSKYNLSTLLVPGTLYRIAEDNSEYHCMELKFAKLV